MVKPKKEDSLAFDLHGRVIKKVTSSFENKNFIENCDTKVVELFPT